MDSSCIRIFQNEIKKALTGVLEKGSTPCSKSGAVQISITKNWTTARRDISFLVHHFFHSQGGGRFLDKTNIRQTNRFDFVMCVPLCHNRTMSNVWDLSNSTIGVGFGTAYVYSCIVPSLKIYCLLIFRTSH
jgi:hypothetical protein